MCVEGRLCNTRTLDRAKAQTDRRDRPHSHYIPTSILKTTSHHITSIHPKKLQEVGGAVPLYGSDDDDTEWGQRAGELEEEDYDDGE